MFEFVCPSVCLSVACPPESDANVDEYTVHCTSQFEICFVHIHSLPQKFGKFAFTNLAPSCSHEQKKNLIEGLHKRSISQDDLLFSRVPFFTHCLQSVCWIGGVQKAHTVPTNRYAFVVPFGQQLARLVEVTFSSL